MCFMLSWLSLVKASHIKFLDLIYPVPWQGKGEGWRVAEAGWARSTFWVQGDLTSYKRAMDPDAKKIMG